MAYAGFFVILGLTLILLWGWVATLPMSTSLYMFGSALLLMAIVVFLTAIVAYRIAQAHAANADSQDPTVEIALHESGEFRIKTPIRERQRSR